MICKSCGCIYFRKNKQGICLSCYTNRRVKENMVYKKKVWNKFTWDTQQELTKQYAVTFENEKSLKLKIREFFKRRTPEERKRNKIRISKGFNKFKKLLDQFSNGMNKLHFEGGSDASMNKITGGLNKASGVDHNFDVLTGRKKRKQKNSDAYTSLSDGNDRDFSL